MGLLNPRATPWGQRPRAHPVDERLEFLECFRVESVHASTITAIRNQASVLQGAQVKGEERLADAKSLLQVTDDTLPSAQQNENPQSSFVGDRFQEWQQLFGRQERRCAWSCGDQPSELVGPRSVTHRVAVTRSRPGCTLVRPPVEDESSEVELLVSYGILAPRRSYRVKRRLWREDVLQEITVSRKSDIVTQTER